ncbi:MAG TPA: PBP1A family penicillin-binding protein [Rhizomicrobium sp.]|jgi:penicillin-binding protein 1A|nr:PBP1A family penicillin-binding protein [Rhizomicrobium sp.]
MSDGQIGWYWDRLRQIAQTLRPFAPILAALTLIVAVPLTILYMIPVVLGWFAPPLDPHTDLYAVNRPLAFTFLDVDGDEIGHRGAVVGDRLTLEQMPPYLPAAFVAMEDRRFYSHNGIDARGLARALYLDLRAGHWVAGGSTISQQTAKIVYTNQQRTISRKLTELIDAAGLEKSLSKKQILELYLNRIYLGSGAYGVDGAARVYFGTSARHLTLAQAAMLATLTRAPSVFSPRRDLLKAQQRASLVLDVMEETGAITDAEATWARAHPAVIASHAETDARNFFLDAAADQAMQLATRGGVAPNADMVVHTTMEPRLQDAARAAVQRIIHRYGKRDRVHEAAMVMMKPDGAVSALIGGVDYRDSVFDRATKAHRQPGSAFKPFVYLAALESGITPWDYRDDEAVDIDGWQPANYGGHSYGTVTIAEALAHSVNTITANLAQEVGIPTVIAAAKRCGIISPLADNASLALGTSEVTPLELTDAYAAFANGGFRVDPYLVTEVDMGGKPVWRRTPPKPKRVIASATDRDMVAMLYGVVTGGTGRAAAIPGHEAAGKTGTTQDSHDAWFVGFTTDYVAAAWVGNDDSSPTRGVTGGTLPAQIWRQAMTVAEKGLPSKALDKSAPPPPPEEDAGLLASGEPPSYSDDEAAKLGPPPAEAPGAPPPPAVHHHRGGLLGWLFGDDDDDDRNTAPPPGNSDSR